MDAQSTPFPDRALKRESAQSDQLAGASAVSSTAVVPPLNVAAAMEHSAGSVTAGSRAGSLQQNNVSVFSLAKQGPMPWDVSPRQRTPSVGGISARQNQDKEMFSAVRRQMDILEERLAGQISRVQQQSERSRDASVKSLDNKLANLEMFQPNINRKLAELSGNCKGLSEEMQSQIRRVDQMDARLWEWRHKMDEEIRIKFTELESAHQQVSSLVRVTGASNDDVLNRFNQRLSRLESLLEEKDVVHDDLSHSVMDMHSRLLHIEHETTTPRGSLLIPETQNQGSVTDNDTHFKSTVDNLCHKTATVQVEVHNLHTRVEENEERHRLLRAAFDSKDDQYRSLSDRIERENWLGHLRDLSSRLDDATKGFGTHRDTVQILQKKLDRQEEALTDIGNQLRRLQGRGSIANPSSQEWQSMQPDSGDAAHHHPAHPEAGDCVGRLANVESHVGALELRIEAMRSDVELAPRVAKLVETLKDVSPRVVGQGDHLQQLQRRFEDFQHAEGVVHDGLVMRLGHVEQQVQRLVNEVEGIDDDPAMGQVKLEGSAAKEADMCPDFGSSGDDAGGRSDNRGHRSNPPSEEAF